MQVAVAGALSGALVIGTPLMPGAVAQPAGVRTPSATATGHTFGGTTTQDFPAIVEMKATRRFVIRAVVALRLECTSGSFMTFPDEYRRIRVNAKGKFQASFGPTTNRNDDGTTTDYQGSMKGALNAGKTFIIGTWSLSATDHDATGAVTDTCTGEVTWIAKQ